MKKSCVIITDADNIREELQNAIDLLTMYHAETERSKADNALFIRTYANLRRITRQMCVASAL